MARIRKSDEEEMNRRLNAEIEKGKILYGIDDKKLQASLGIGQTTLYQRKKDGKYTAGQLVKIFNLMHLSNETVLQVLGR